MLEQSNGQRNSRNVWLTFHRETYSTTPNMVKLRAERWHRQPRLAAKNSVKPEISGRQFISLNSYESPGETTSKVTVIIKIIAQTRLLSNAFKFQFVTPCGVKTLFASHPTQKTSQVWE